MGKREKCCDCGSWPKPGKFYTRPKLDRPNTYLGSREQWLSEVLPGRGPPSGPSDSSSSCELCYKQIAAAVAGWGQSTSTVSHPVKRPGLALTPSVSWRGACCKYGVNEPIGSITVALSRLLCVMGSKLISPHLAGASVPWALTARAVDLVACLLHRKP
jgi:hypothetical protein